MSASHSAPADRAFPAATYRLQLHRGFRFADAAALAPYLAALGVTHVYSSPLLKAAPGSTHGYDICDHNEINPEIGSADEHRAFVEALHAHGLGQIVDFVPNHMGIDARVNPWWRDVLENGPCSPYARFFDVDWHPVKDELEQKVLLPILGDQYGRVLERGELRIQFDGAAFHLRYYDHELPLNPRQATRILEQGVDTLAAQLDPDDPQLIELLSIITALRNLPIYTETEPERVVERQREKEVARERLSRLVAESEIVARHVDASVAHFNGDPRVPSSFDPLHELLELQPYRLAYWRTASHEINYRRFFDVNQLAGLRMEDPLVFAATHKLLMQCIAAGDIDGLRIDHIDGLADPEEYLERLSAAAGEARGDPAAPFYVVVEKILSSGEALRDNWRTQGTSGYDFLNELNGLFVDGRAQRAFRRVYERFTRRSESFADIVYASKKLIAETPMSSELNVLAHALNRFSERDRRTRDFTLNSLRDALQEVAACFPIYRTYVSPRGVADADRDAIASAIRAARWRNPTMEPSIFDFVHNTLAAEPRGAPSAEHQAQRLAFAMKFQQYTGPLQAKGVEDTAFYRFNTLLSLNEVGGEPDRFGRPPADFHAANAARRARWPRAMLATTTHDTKRGEDARARLNLLSEMPDEWRRRLSAWARVNASHRTSTDKGPAPDRNDEYLYYQALLGAWPAGANEPGEELVARMQGYLLKAAREAKVHSSWIAEDPIYEEALRRFVDRTLASSRFLSEFVPFQRRIARLGAINSLAQVVLKTAAPGVPDFYQGSELWDLSLVDPDNRRPVDFETRHRLLDDLEPLLTAAEGHAPAQPKEWRELLDQREDGRVKLLVTAAALRCRRRLHAVFLDGDYVALEPRGARAGNVVAFARVGAETTVIAVAPRLVAALGESPIGPEVWGDTEIPLHGPPRALRNALTGEILGPREHLPVAEIFASAPVALLEIQSAT